MSRSYYGTSTSLLYVTIQFWAGELLWGLCDVKKLLWKLRDVKKLLWDVKKLLICDDSILDW